MASAPPSPEPEAEPEVPPLVVAALRIPREPGDPEDTPGFLQETRESTSMPGWVLPRRLDDPEDNPGYKRTVESLEDEDFDWSDEE